MESSSKTVDRVVINDNMTLRYCYPNPIAQETDQKTEDKPTRKLAVLFGWMLAQEQHLEKYRNLYFKRGFDVLTVNTRPFELLLPERGSQRIAKNALNFMNESLEDYPQIVIHSFSVGAYQFGEVLVQMENNENKDKDLIKSIKGLICDSGADMEALPYGLSRAITNNWIIGWVLKNYITFHMKMFHSIATKHYMASYEAFKNNVIRCPALLLVSQVDVVGNREANQRVMNYWENSGIDVQWKCFESSSHVGHLHKYPKEYEGEIDSFLKKVIKLKLF